MLFRVYCSWASFHVVQALEDYRSVGLDSLYPEATCYLCYRLLKHLISSNQMMFTWNSSGMIAEDTD